MTATDEHWMSQALELARRAADQDEVPVGAVVVRDGELLGEGWNQPRSLHDPTAHAEAMALRAAAARVSNYRLPGAMLYVTLEPCVMCAGALVHARIEEVVFGAFDPKTGAAGTVFDILGSPLHNHQVRFRGGIMEQACGELLREFFRGRR